MKPIIVLDFDGVITSRGEELKQEAWDTLAKDRSPKFRSMLKRMRDAFSDGRGDRNHILLATYAALGEYTLDDARAFAKKDSESYNRIVQEAVCAEGMRNETPEALKMLRDAGFMLYLNSATPESPVRESCERLGIADFFSGIFGMPARKVENFKRIITDAREKGFPALAIIFVGDSPGDVAAAKEFDCLFIGVANDCNKWGERTLGFPIVRNLNELLPIIENIVT